MSLLLQHPWFIAKVERAIAKYGRRWTPEQTRAFREQMAFTIATHPKVRALLALARSEIDRRLWELEPS